MPVNIPVYQQQVTPQLGTSGAQAQFAPEQDNTSSALARVGSGLTDVAAVLHVQQQQDQQATVAKQIGDDRVKWLQYTQDAKDTAGPGAPDFTPKLLTNFDDYANESLSKMQDGPAKNFYQTQLTGLRTSLATDAVSWQAQQHKAYNVDQYSQGNDSAARTIAMDPTQYGNVRASQLALIGASNLDQVTKDRLVDNFKDMASTAAGMRAVTGDPNSAYKALTQNPNEPLPAGYDWVSDLPPQKLTVLQGHALTLIQQQQNAADAQAQKRENDGVTAYNQAFDIVNQGKQLTPTYQTTLQTTTAGTSVAGQTNELIQQAAKNAGFSSLPLAAMRTAIQADQTAANTPGVGTDPLTVAAVKQRQQILTASEQAYKTDPWNAAQDRGVIQAVPQVDTSSIQGLTQSLTSRAAAVGQVENAAGRRVSLLTPDESTRALQLVQALPITQQAQALSAIGTAYGQGARINDLAEQWKEKDPAIGLSLKYGAMGAGGNPLLTSSGQPVATFVLSGQQALKDKKVKIDETAGTGMKATIANAIDGAMPPDQAADAKEGAYYIAIGSAAYNNREQPNATDIQNGINSATGGVSTTGGTRFDGKPNTVAMPYGWREDDFQSAVKTASPAEIENTVGGKPIDTVYANGTAIPVADFMSKFPSYQLVRVGVRGSYAVSTGSKFVTDSTGKPLTITLTSGQKSAPAANAAPAASTDTVDNSFTPQM